MDTIRKNTTVIAQNGLSKDDLLADLTRKVGRKVVGYRHLAKIPARPEYSNYRVTYEVPS